jgi:hypothetical protein
MKPTKSWFVAFSAVLCLAVWTVLAADDRAQELSERLAAVSDESQMRQAADNVAVFKKAGLSYQPGLAVPVEGILGCKDREQMGMLIGMYTFDANYALLFGRKQEFAAANGLRSEIPDRLNLRGRLKFQTFTPDELEKVLDNPDDPANRELYIKYAAALFHDMSEASKGDQEILGVFMDSVTGALVQGLYVACRLALAAGTGERLVAVFNEQASRLDMFHQTLAAYAGDPELEAVTKRSHREALMRPVSEILKTKKGNLAEADVARILSLIEPERSKVVRICR